MRIFQVDAFTDTRFTGNPAVVVLDPDGQSDSTLQAIAREFAHAEVAFVSAATAADHDVRLRFFNARKEAPFVGHATIAAHAVLLALGRRAEGVCRQHSGTGIIEVQARDHGGALIEFRQIAPELAPPLPSETTLRVAEALGLPAAQTHPLLPTRIARRGSTRLLLPVSEARALDTLNPNFDTLVALGKELGTDGFFVFSINRGQPDRRPLDPDPLHPDPQDSRPPDPDPQESRPLDPDPQESRPLDPDSKESRPLDRRPRDRAPEQLSTDSRMFCPALGIPEDPVSGNAHAMLAAYLWELGQFSRSSPAFVGHQGRQMNRPGKVGVRLETLQGSLVAAHIGGRAVIVSEGTMAP